ncbi:MAG: hypothetical protein FWC39_04065 [Bacteroidetes bacterium]|nr:hypothetical protein [Bacteroidota bacterium]
MPIRQYANEISNEKNNYCYILEKMDCFVPRKDALSLICANPRKSVIANEVKQPERSGAQRS